MNKYVVFEQDRETKRINIIVGPFNDYDLATEYAGHMSTVANERFYYGIRILEPTVAMRMSK